MGRYAYLFSSGEPIPNVCVEEDGLALVANYRVPIFWTALFTPDSFGYTVPVSQDIGSPCGELEPYCTLETSSAIEQFQRRREAIFQVLPTNYAPLASRFLELIRGKGLDYLHFSQGELANMRGTRPDEWERVIKCALATFDDDPWRSPTGIFAAFSKPRLNRRWRDTFELAGIASKPLSKVEPWELVGRGGRSRRWPMGVRTSC